MKKFVIIFALFVVLTGCAKKQVITVCKGTYNDTEVEHTIVATGDEVTSVRYLNTTYVEKGYIGYITNYLEQHKEVMSCIQGVTYEYTINDTVVVEITTIDYTVADMDQLVEAGLVEMSNSEKPSYIGYKSTVNFMIAQGLTCAEQ